MSAFAGQTYWLVGASEGLGRALAQQMSAAGAKLVLSARNEARLAELAASLPHPAQVVPCDVADRASVAKAAERAGPIDGLIYLAALYWPIRTQDWRPDAVEAMCDVNFTGCARVLGQVVPEMLAKGRGHIVLVGSLAGFRGLPGAIGYAASKAAVMNLAECLYADLKHTGIRVQLVNPGFIATRLTAKNSFHMPFLLTPDQAARRILAHMQSKKFRLSFPFWFSLLFRWGRFLPDPVWAGLFAPRGEG